MKRIPVALVAAALLLRGAFAFDPDSPPALEPDVAALVQYKAFDNREPQMVVSDRVQAAAGDAAARAQLNDQMLALLTAESSSDAKEFALRQLAQIASPESPAYVADYLGDEHLAIWARMVLEKVNTPGAVAVLLRAVEQLDGTPQIGAINSLGTIRAEKAVKPLAKRLPGAGPETGWAIINALGKIGNEDAIKTLTKVAEDGNPEQSTAAAETLLAWAARQIADGVTQPALEIMQDLQHNTAFPPAVRQGALVRIAKADPEAALDPIRQLVLKEDARSAAFAMRFVREAGKPDLTPQFVALLDQASSATQVLLLAALGDRGDAAALPALRAHAAQGESPVRVAAVQALGELGTAEDLPALLKLAAEGTDGPLQAAARDALAVMRGDLDQTLASSGSNPAEQAEAVKALGARQAAGALEAIQKAAVSPEPAVREAAIDAYAALGRPETMPVLAEMLAKSTEAKERAELELALIQVGKPIVDENMRIGALLEQLKPAQASANRTSLIKVLGELRGGGAFQALMTETGSNDADARRAAIKALGNWDSTGPADRLNELATQGDEPAIRVLAMQGYVRMLSLMTDKGPEVRVPLYRGALEAATRPEEKRLALSGLSAIHTKDALDLARGGLSNPDLAEEAAAATATIAWELRDADKEAALNALKEAQSVTQNEPLKAKIADELKQLGS